MNATKITVQRTTISNSEYYKAEYTHERNNKLPLMYAAYGANAKEAEYYLLRLLKLSGIKGENK